MKIRLSLEKTRGVTLILLVSLLCFSIISFVYGVGLTTPQRFGHTGGEIDVDFAGLTLPLPSALTRLKSSDNQRTVIVRHSQTTGIPSCEEKGWNTLWTGYSYAGLTFHNLISPSPQDLGKSGSCLETFHPFTFQNCWQSGSGFACETSRDHQFTSWLTANPTHDARTYEFWAPTDREDIKTYAERTVSRCSVCEAPKMSVIVRHNLDGDTPECPTGWSELWRGSSLTYSQISGFGPQYQDLGSTGSCLPRFIPIPVLECGDPDNGHPYCRYVTGGDAGGWLTTHKAINTGAETSGAPPHTALLARTAQCVVCSSV